MKKKNYLLFTTIAIVLLFVVSCQTPQHTDDATQDNPPTTESDTPTDFEQNPGATPLLDGEIQTTSDGTKYIVNPNEILSGGPPKGGIGFDRGIPALAEKNIDFVTVQVADKWIQDQELVLALQYDGVKRVYPLQILVFHEIVNDEINGLPILITYCPLCGSGIAYERTIELNGQKVATRFGTSGKLYNSNLVMYDESTDTYWQQIDGKAIVGKLTGQELNKISIDTVAWRDWKKAHPESEVLSQKTGMNRPYGNDPYPGYYENSFLFFPVDNEDNSIHPKTVIFGTEVGGVYKAYREEDLLETPIIKDVVNDVNIVVERGDDGVVKIINQQTGEEIVKERDFWFAWYAFHPNTQLYGAQ